MSHPQISKKEQTRIKRQFSLVKEHQVKDDMVYQQAFLIALANQYFGFTILSPLKMAHITKTLPKIVKIHFDDDSIDLLSFAEIQSKNLLIHQSPFHTSLHSISPSSQNVSSNISLNSSPSNEYKMCHVANGMNNIINCLFYKFWNVRLSKYE